MVIALGQVLLRNNTMKRNAFTMVELIFVIVILGIVASIGLPKFTAVRDNAKMTSEIAALGSLDSAINAAIEFRFQDYGDTNVAWHGAPFVDAVIDELQRRNATKEVLKSILNKSEEYYIVGVMGYNEEQQRVDQETFGSEGTLILLIKGPASNKETGVNQPSQGDVIGRPDKSDLWCFNPTPIDINISSAQNYVLGSSGESWSIVPSRSMKLIDINASSAINHTSNEITIGSEGYGPYQFMFVAEQ